MDVLIIYQFCSFGGVERFILNRAMAFKKHGLDVVLSVGYLHDYGAMRSFKEYIRLNGLGETLRPFLMSEDDSSAEKSYDLILVIDTPQVLDRFIGHDNVYVECHTPYRKNREYLKALPDNVRGIIVPTSSFRSIVGGEYPDLPEIHVLPYSVPDEFFHIQSGMDIYTRRPLAYLARLDSLKNYAEVLDLFGSLKERRDIMHIIIGEQERGDSIYATLSQKGLLANTLLRYRLDFDKVPDLIGMVRQHRGAFISASRGESCGLSAAEFICGGVPVLLSNIPAHRELVNDDERFLYPLGNLAVAKRKIAGILGDWESMAQVIPAYGRKFESDHFIRTWMSIFGGQGREADQLTAV